jgi:hypothetical protein
VTLKDRFPTKSLFGIGPLFVLITQVKLKKEDAGYAGVLKKDRSWTKARPCYAPEAPMSTCIADLIPSFPSGEELESPFSDCIEIALNDVARPRDCSHQITDR